MRKRKRSAPKPGKTGKGETPEEVKVRLLTRKNPSSASGIIDAPVIKDGDLFLVTKPDGLIPFEDNHGFGLYHHDCRYLSGYRIEVNGAAMDTLSCTTQAGYESVFQWTNPALRGKGGRKAARIPEHSLGLRLTHLLSLGESSMRDILEIRNFSVHPVTLEIRIFLRAGFEDVFNIRGLDGRRPGAPGRPKWSGPVREFPYRGGDGAERILSVRFPDSVRKGKGMDARFDLAIPPESSRRLDWVFLVREGDGGRGPRSARPDSRSLADSVPDADKTGRLQAEERDRHTSRGAELACDQETVNAVVNQSLQDLRSLQCEILGQKFFAAGVPWFVTLFGRDALTACLQTLAFDPDASLGTLRLLARMQGAKVDAWTDEEPGRILHEFRRGELARAGLIPYSPFFGTVDATCLFLILLVEYSRWIGSLDLFRELRAAVDLALQWMDRFGDANGDGYLEYAYPPVGSQINLGWKDAGDSIVTGSGSLAKSPISLVEVQGYAYRARLGIADLLRRNGETDLAEELEAEASDLRARFNRDFWMEGKKFFALALHGSGGQADAISSNPGQALWAGIIDRSRAGAVRAKLMSEELFAGWGVRTLATGEKRYNPMSYHHGSVWPHDNSLIAAGLKDYGFDQDAMLIFQGLLAAAARFPEHRLPELFCGFSREAYPQPVRYPIACHPQAWAAGSIPFLLTSLLGLRPDGFARRLVVERPRLPAGCGWLEWKRLRVGEARADLRFERDGDRVRVSALRIEGRLELAVAEAEGGKRPVG
jgi:glycogen debranching enzyme